MGNLAFPLMMGNKDATDAAFAKAKHTVSVRLYNNRITANTMEPRSCIGDYNAADDAYTLYTSSQNPHGVRTIVCGPVFHMPETKLRVISPDVGGGFGMKGDIYPEDGLVLWASRKLGRPVKWVGTRTESLLGDNHGRDQLISAEMALDENGKILAVRAQAPPARPRAHLLPGGLWRLQRAHGGPLRPKRHGDDRRRHAFAWPGPRHHLGAARLRLARRAVRECSPGAGRHRRRVLRPRHLCLEERDARRLGAARG